MPTTQRILTHSNAVAVGISIMIPQGNEALRPAREIKRRWPNNVVIAGGPHVSTTSEGCRGQASYDYLVPLDGERALPQILSGRATSRVVSDVLTREDVLNQPRPDRRSR
jgi:radical SAM superfamily enzyme YgiQ (UPF0313 family)